MNGILTFLKGKRTYIVAALAGLAVALNLSHVLSWEQLKIVDMILAPFGLAFLRAAVDGTNQAGK